MLTGKADKPFFLSSSNAGSRLRLAMWTPLPPLANGIAAYSVELIDILARHVEIDLFVDDGYEPPAVLLDEYRVYRHHVFESRHSAQPYDAIIYQLGNSRAHYYMLEALKKWPGIVVLHD